ncbi:hypothetical protein EV2_039171 [Malus domestica]
MAQPFFKAQSEIDDCDDVEDYDYGNHDDVRDENLASAMNNDGEEDQGDENEEGDEDEGSKDENVNRRTKIMEEHVEMMNKQVEELYVALQVENRMFKQENEQLKKRIKELEAKITVMPLGTSNLNTNNQMLEKYQEDHPASSMDTAAEFTDPMDVLTWQNEANVQKKASTTPEGPKVDVVKKVVEVYIEMEEEKLSKEKLQTPQFMSTYTWQMMKDYVEPTWSQNLYEPM